MTDLVEFIKARLDREESDANLISSGGYQPQEWCLVSPTEQALEIDDETYAELRAVDRVIGDPPGDQDEDGGVVAYVRSGRNEHLHMARYDPARVLREVEAKRRTLARHYRDDRGACVGCGWSGDLDEPRTDVHEECPELLDMALPWSDHPDYLPEWPPENVVPTD